MATSSGDASSSPSSTTKPSCADHQENGSSIQSTKSPQEHLITEIESADGHLGSTLRAVYDYDKEGKETVDMFMERISTRIKSHDKEIERMCNFHYQGFIESIRGLLQMRSEVGKFKTEIESTNTKLQSSGHSLVLRADKLIQYRKIQRNIALAIDTMSTCLPVLEMYGKLQDQLRSKRYYPALKTLEQLEHTYLPRVEKYRFTKSMCSSVPSLREDIRKASMSDLKDFLENIRKHSDRIGEIAMKHAAEQNNMDPAIAVKKEKIKKRRAPKPPNPFTGEVEEDNEDEDASNPFLNGHGGGNPFDEEDEQPSPLFNELNLPKDKEDGRSAQDFIDFAPVYRCLHIHTVLGVRETFENYYRTQRKKQARLVLKPAPNMSKEKNMDIVKEKSKQLFDRLGYDPNPHETLEGYRKYFHDIVGFFVVEDHILNTTTGLVNREYMDQMWELALGKTAAALRINTTICKDPAMFLQIKNLIMLFSHTLRVYGFSVSQLYGLLLELKDEYCKILGEKWIGVFNEIFEKDNYTPIQVNDEEEYQSVISVYPYYDAELEMADFPKAFPFSQFVPKVYNEVKEYVYACLKFCEDLHISQTEIDDMIRKLANTLLTETLGDCLKSLIVKPHLGLLELIQISLNMDYLDKSCVYLEDFITNITGENIHASKLQGTAMFKDQRYKAEEEIYKKLNEKIDVFFELANCDWSIPEATGHPNDYITELITFLTFTFQSFTNLPEKVAQTACMLACKHIANAMLGILMDSEVKFISNGALMQFNLDLLQCELFAASSPVPGLKDGTLSLAFVDLRQLMDLFMSWDWASYLADYGKDSSKYLRVQPNICINLLEKMKETDKSKTIFLTSLKKNERDKRKLMDTVLKQLRQLGNGHIQQ